MTGNSPDTTRHGKRAPGTVTCTIPMPEKLRDILEEMGGDIPLATFVRSRLWKMARKHEAAKRGRKSPTAK